MGGKRAQKIGEIVATQAHSGDKAWTSLCSDRVGQPQRMDHRAAHVLCATGPLQDSWIPGMPFPVGIGSSAEPEEGVKPVGFLCAGDKFHL